jgi:hypothetical protein
MFTSDARAYGPEVGGSPGLLQEGRISASTDTSWRYRGHLSLGFVFPPFTLVHRS